MNLLASSSYESEYSLLRIDCLVDRFQFVPSVARSHLQSSRFSLRHHQLPTHSTALLTRCSDYRVFPPSLGVNKCISRTARALCSALRTHCAPCGGYHLSSGSTSNYRRDMCRSPSASISDSSTTCQCSTSNLAHRCLSASLSRIFRGRS